MKWKKSALTIGTAASLLLGTLPAVSFAQQNDKVAIQQGNGAGILGNANYFGDLDPSTVVTVDIVMKLQNKDGLAHYINETTDKYSIHFRKYLSVNDFKENFAPSSSQVSAVTKYLNYFGITSKVYQDNLIITASGTVDQFNKAFNVDIQKASYKGKYFHATKRNPTAPKNVAENILCILGLSDYSNFKANSIKRSDTIAPEDNNSPSGPLSLTPQDLIKQYNVGPLYSKGADGSGQTIGIVSLADFNSDDAYSFWDQMGINVKPDRIEKINVDGGTGWDGYDETTLDVQQSGALAPKANIKAYLAPNSDTGFVDCFAKAINDNKVQTLSVSWGLSETILQMGVQQNVETPEYAESFNQLYMQAAAQGISMFAAAGDAGAYDTGRNGYYDLSVDNPADSPYITAAGGTTLPFHFTSASTGITVSVDKERAWGWDYLGNYFKARNLPLTRLVEGGGGGFSKLFPTPDYQKGVKGVNHYSAVQDFTISDDFLSVTGFNGTPKVIHGTDSGRNMPDLSMNSDPYTGYYVYLSDPGAPGQNSGYAVYGGTSFVSPQLNGLTALINSADHTQVGFWNPQIYRYAQQKDSPLHPLNDAGANNDNGYYTGTPSTIYNQATGLGTPDVTKLAEKFGK
ncbi:S53 family peptidase [Neobacillus terrae]|uniref:S53 family peptidase n=1 Tax=Neobacillus terrae TaxID=3034837 RepID=UPI00140D86D2|nr:protease pro-enzyme activation domain-containing protein [Neobacillus terrae]NHM30740.1 S8 family serine peptidase [Neobacillus terrae]